MCEIEMIWAEVKKIPLCKVAISKNNVSTLYLYNVLKLHQNFILNVENSC